MFLFCLVFVVLLTCVCLVVFAEWFVLMVWCVW